MQLVLKIASACNYVAQAWVQKQERHNAALETEHRSLKHTIGSACFAFDESLVSLQLQRDAAEASLCMIQMQRAAITSSHEHQLHLQQQLERGTQQLSQLGIDLTSKQQMVKDVIQTLDKWVCLALLNTASCCGLDVCA